MSYDAKVPLMLRREQQWFGSIIGRPIDDDNRMDPVSPSGVSMEIEAAQHIAASPTMQPAERIQIYNQQYWWRLLNTLHESFPFLICLLGYYHFNRKIAMPYLVKYPPRHWALMLLGDRLAQWIEEEYQGNDKSMLVNAAAIDYAFSASFIAADMPSLNIEQLSHPDQVEKIFDKKLYVQPHLHLFEMNQDYFHYREEILKQKPEYWQTHPLPQIKSGQYFYALYRNARNEISWKEISFGEYHLLRLFQKGASVEEACEWLEEHEDEMGPDASQNLQQWFQEWTHRGWLSMGSN